MIQLVQQTGRTAVYARIKGSSADGAFFLIFVAADEHAAAGT